MPAHTITIEGLTFNWATISNVLALSTARKRLIAVHSWRCPLVKLEKITEQRQIASLCLGLIRGNDPDSFTTALMDEVIAIALENQTEVIADFYYQPAERRTLEYPGCREEMTLESVSLAGVDITSCISDHDRDWLEEYALEQFADQRAADAAEERASWRTGT